LWGHGAYLGPDYSAEYLHRTVEIGQETLARAKYGTRVAALDEPQRLEIAEALKRELKQNNYDPATATLRFTAVEAASFRAQLSEWSNYFGGATPAPGLPKGFITDVQELRDLTAYFSWAAWATTALRPGTDYS